MPVILAEFFLLIKRPHKISDASVFYFIYIFVRCITIYESNNLGVMGLDDNLISV